MEEKPIGRLSAMAVLWVLALAGLASLATHGHL
jgi:hypothetical protein